MRKAWATQQTDKQNIRWDGMGTQVQSTTIDDAFCAAKVPLHYR